MAAFACFSNSKEKTTDAYKDLIKRFRESAKKELGDIPTVTRCSFSYFSTHKGKTTHFFRDFIYQLRKRMFVGVCVFLCENPTPIFKCFVRLIERLKLRDGRNSSAYYGELKKIITGFMNYFTHTIDDVVKKIDKYINVYTNDELINLIDSTVKIFEQNQNAFLNEYLPITSQQEMENYNEVIEKQKKFMEEIKIIKQHWEVHRQDTIRILVKENFELSIRKHNMLCSFAHSYLSVMLADRLYEISVSVEETVDRMNTNLRQYNEECTRNLNRLYFELYEKNKEHLSIYRRQKKRSVDTAEVNRAIERLIEKIEHYGNEETMARLELETRYWKKRLKDFNEIAAILTKIRLELDKVLAEEEKYLTLKTTELPGSKTICFELIGENYKERKLYLEEKLMEASRTLITFFCVRGTDRILYTDSVGSYYCDEFNHQNYITNYGLKFFHVNCYGDFLENLETEPYYFDENGRYILVRGEKLHQCAPCTSQYKLGDDGLLKKVTKDCGHSERISDNCRLEIKDITDVVILPKADIIDIRGTLDGETVKYLWDSFGMILPDVLYATATAQVKNPIHYMAHILLKRRFEATVEEFQVYKEMANEYRNKIYKELKDKAAEETRAWKSKLVKRRKPEESDDTLDWAAYDQKVADWQFVNSLGYYN